MVISKSKHRRLKVLFELFAESEADNRFSVEFMFVDFGPIIESKLEFFKRPFTNSLRICQIVNAAITFVEGFTGFGFQNLFCKFIKIWPLFVLYVFNRTLTRETDIRELVAVPF